MNAIIDQQRQDSEEFQLVDAGYVTGDGSFLVRLNRSPFLRELGLSCIKAAEAYRQKVNRYADN